MAVSFSWSVSLGSAVASTSSGADADQVRDIALNATGTGLELLDGDLVLLEGVEAYVSDLKSYFETWLSEYFLDTTLGLAWSSILGHKLDPEFLRAEFTRVIMSVPGSTEVTSLTVTQVGREITANFRVTYSGDTMVAVVLGVSVGGEA